MSSAHLPERRSGEPGDELKTISKTRVLLRMTVDIAAGRSETIELREGESAERRAAMFVEEHGLGPKLVGPLSKYIQQNLDKAAAAAAARRPAAGNPGSRRDSYVAVGEENVPPLTSKCDDAEKPRLASSETNKPPSAPAQPLVAPRNPAPPAVTHPAASTVHPVGPSQRTGTERFEAAEAAGAGGATKKPSLATRPKPTKAGTSSAAVRQSKRSPTKRAGGSRSQATSRDCSPSRMSLKPGGGSSHPDPHASEVVERLLLKGEMRVKKLEEERRRRAAELEEAVKGPRSHMSQVSQELMKDRTKGEYQNYGHRLYDEGRIHRKQLEELQAAASAEAAQREVESLKPGPEISKVSARMMEGADSWRRLHDTTHQTAKEKKIAQIKQQMEEDELRQCSFKPNINRKSKVLMKDRSVIMREYNKSTHELLFMDAARRRERKEEYECWMSEDHTFHPDVAATGLFTTDSMHEETDVLERLQEAERRREKNMQQLRESLQCDPATGQPLFQPRTGRAPTNARNAAHLPIGDFLYSVRHEFEDRKESMAERERYIVQKEAAMSKVNDMSEMYVQRMKRRVFQQLFQSLDHDGDGVLKLDEILAHEDLNPMLRSDVQDLMAITGPTCVDLDTFQAAMEQVVAEIKKGPRSYLRPMMDKARIPEDEFDFKPRLNKTTKELAERRRGGQSSLYETMVNKQKLTEYKLEQMKRMQEEAELKECTFKPVTQIAGPFSRGGLGPKRPNKGKAAAVYQPNAGHSQHASLLDTQQVLRAASEGATMVHGASQGLAPTMHNHHHQLSRHHQEQQQHGAALEVLDDDERSLSEEESAVPQMSQERLRMLEQELQHVLGLSGCDWQDLNTSMDQRYTGKLKASGSLLDKTQPISTFSSSSRGSGTEGGAHSAWETAPPASHGRLDRAFERIEHNLQPSAPPHSPHMSLEDLLGSSDDGEEEDSARTAFTQARAKLR